LKQLVTDVAMKSGHAARLRTALPSAAVAAVAAAAVAAVAIAAASSPRRRGAEPAAEPAAKPAVTPTTEPAAYPPPIPHAAEPATEPSTGYPNLSSAPAGQPDARASKILMYSAIQKEIDV
jgi:hypothetical protein